MEGLLAFVTTVDKLSVGLLVLAILVWNQPYT